MPQVTKGDLVYSSDGELLGAIEEMRQRHFKLDSQMSLDYWLPIDCLELGRGDVLMTSFPRSDLEDYRVEAGAL